MSTGLFYIAGPLTTLYVPPSPCFTPAFDNDATSFRQFGATCSIDSNEAVFTPHPFTDFSCFPTITQDYLKAFNSISYQETPTLLAYSPGLICPSGFTSNLEVARATDDFTTVTTSTSSWESTDYLRASLLAGESGLICCRSGGWTAGVDEIGPYCFSSVPVGQSMSGIAFGTGSSCESFSATITQPPDLHSYYIADGFVLLRQETDPSFTPTLPASAVQSIVASSSSVAASLSSASAASNQVTKFITQTPSDSPGDSGLSGGAKAGIGVGVSLAVILAIAAGALFYWFRSRKRARKAASREGNDVGAWKPELDGAPARKEMDGYSTATYSASGVQYQKIPPAELEGSMALYELPR